MLFIGESVLQGANWFEQLPLLGWRVLVPRTKDPLDQVFALPRGGQEQMMFAPQIPTGTLWNITVNCTDPVQSQTATVYNQPMIF